MSLVETEIWVPYTAVLRLPGRRGHVRATRFSRETFGIASHAPSDRSVALEADLGDGRRLTWRDYGGSYWRPLVTEGLRPVHELSSAGWDVRPEG